MTNTRSKKSHDGEYRSIKLSKSTKTSKALSITKIVKSQIKIKKLFTILNKKTEEMDNEDFDFTDSDDDDE